MKCNDWIVVGVGLLASGLWVGDADAASLRCGNRLVGSGDSTYEVRAVCGEPDHAESRVEYRTVRERVRAPCMQAPNGKVTCESVRERTVEILIERYTYDFGKNRFIEFVTFEQGRLVAVDTGSYGHKPAR